LDHPELRALLSDFLQALLLRKPANMITFAQQYFESFLKIRPATKTDSVVLSSSSSAESSVNESGEWGEWTEVRGNDPSLLYYNVKPTRSIETLEKVSDDDFTEQTDNSDKKVSVGPDGQYVVTGD
jgi:hypothetical protein